MFTARQKEIISQTLTHLGMTYNEDATTVALLLDSARVTNNVPGAKGKPLSSSHRQILSKGLRALGIKDQAPPRPGYREFVEYIALNDDRDGLDHNLPSVLVSMVGHLFGKDTDVVIADVRRYQAKHDA